MPTYTEKELGLVETEITLKDGTSYKVFCTAKERDHLLLILENSGERDDYLNIENIDG